MVVTVVSRDQALDSELESGAHTTLILIATGLAFLFTATAIIFYLFPVCRSMRRRLFPQPPVDGGQMLTNTEQVFQPTMTSTPLRQMPALPQRLNQPSYQPEPRTIFTQGSPAFFATRTPSCPALLLAPPNASYDVPNPGFFNHRPSPPNQSYSNHYYRLHLALPTLPPPLPTAIVSPHIARWMKIADDVVGRHPSAKPLSERVASQAEITLISDHVYIPWVHGAKQSRPMPVNALRPGQDAHNRFGHLERSATTENTRGGFPLRDRGLTRFERHLSPSLTVPNHDSTPRREHQPLA